MEIKLGIRKTIRLKEIAGGGKNGSPWSFCPGTNSKLLDLGLVEHDTATFGVGGKRNRAIVTEKGRAFLASVRS